MRSSTQLVGKVRVTVREAGPDVSCCVADQGIGLTTEQITRLLQPFVRFDQTQTGVGLGLFISRGIVEAHQGRLWVESEPGRGSTFCLALPLRSPRHLASDSHASAATDAGVRGESLR